MSSDLISIALDCGMALVSLVALTFILNRMEVHTWIWWVSRKKCSTQDSSVKRYWNAH